MGIEAMRQLIILLTTIGILAHSVVRAETGSVHVASRGEMLYSLHCITCHSKEIHWRDKSVVRDWPGLQVEVDRWQRLARLGWNNADVVETARYLNRLHYRFPESDKP